MNTTPNPLTTTLRYALTMIGSVLTTHGVITAGTWETITGIALAVIPPLYGIVKVWRQSKTA